MKLSNILERFKKRTYIVFGGDHEHTCNIFGEHVGLSLWDRMNVNLYLNKTITMFSVKPRKVNQFVYAHITKEKKLNLNTYCGVIARMNMCMKFVLADSMSLLLCTGTVICI